MKKLITHSGPFHTDELFAIALIELILEGKGESYELIRTRDLSVIETGDFVFDVGGEYDPVKNRFDHHQSEGAGTRENGIPYASIGLAWKHFGMDFCNQQHDVWQEVDERLIQSIDADDVGISTYTIDPKYDTQPYLFKHALKSFYPPWNQKENFDEQFRKLLPFIKEVLGNVIRLAKARFEAVALVEKDYESSSDKRLVILSGGYPWKRVLCEKTEPLLVVCPRSDGTWSVQCVPVSEQEDFTCRIKLPELWAGLRDKEFEDVSGIPSVTFCHRNCWLAGARTKESAVALAKKALLM